MPRGLARWTLRLVLGGLLMAAYVWAWSPARSAWIEHGAAPLLQAVAPAEATLSPQPAAETIHIAPAEGPSVSLWAPAGLKFLLPALLLLVIAPLRPRLGLFFTGHLALGGLTLGLCAADLAGLPGGLRGAAFIQAYVVDAYTLTVPVLVFIRRRAPLPS